MEIIISIAAKIVEYTVALVGQWLCYSFHYNSNIENLKKQEEKLQHAQERVNQSVNDALRKGEKIYSDVNKWLKEVCEITTLATRILRKHEEEAKTRSSHATCLNLKQRHQLSQEVNKITRNIVKHLENGNFNGVSYLPASQDHIVTTRDKNYVTLESRKSVANEIIEALRDANVKKIGVWGMPGVGKSTLMKEIVRRAKEEKLFNGVILEVVKERSELSRIRGEIAVMRHQVQLFRQQTEIRSADLQQESSTKDATKLPVTLDYQLHCQQTEIRRADLQQESSTKDTTKLLVILDDIWEQLGLEDIGIPSEGCKVVLTSRNRDVLVREMGTKKNFELKSLVEVEAWKLFINTAGDSFKDPAVSEVAIRVAKECAGLPIALTAVSKALKGKSLTIWKDAELRLKRPPPADTPPEILSPAFSCIKLSYDQLATEEQKSIFLLCALLGHYILYEDLLKYGFGLGLFEGIVTLEEARHRLNSLLSTLQDSCLLLESSDSTREFSMHDVVRYVATMIGSKDGKMFVMRDNGGLKAWPDEDSLKRYEAFSVLGGEIEKGHSLEIPDTLFQGMDKLKVLDLRKMQLLSLPSSLLLLGNLQTLCLDQCSMLEDISGIGELKNLVVLSLLDSNISKLPREIGSLVHLRLLDLSNCSNLKMIPPNVISSLVKLEELYMGNSFVQWESEGLIDERKNANLAELKDLSLLNTLEIQIPDVSKLPKDFNIKKLEICIGDVWHWIDGAQSSRTLKLKSSFQLELSWIKMLLKSVEVFHLDELNGVKSVIPRLNVEGFQQLKHLQIQNNGEIKHIHNLRTPISLEEICHEKLPSESFKHLRVLKVENCEKLRFVFSSSIASGLSLLEELQVCGCDNMGAIIVEEEEDVIEYGDHMILVNRLQTLILKDLPKLVSFLSTKSSIMTDCGEIIKEGNRDVHMPLLHHQAAFPSLKRMSMVNCGVEEIVAGGGGEPVARMLVFPQVTNLNLINLKRFKWFYKEVYASKWPMLKNMWIEGCEKVEIFASRLVSFQETVEEWRSKMSIQQSLFLVDDDEIAFPSLETLTISHMDNLITIWHDQVTADSFCNIQLLEVTFCESLKSLFPAVLVATSLTQLKILKICNCGIEEIVTRGGDQEETPRFVFPRMSILHLDGLEKLKWFYPGVHTSEWPLLKVIWVGGCQKIEIFASEYMSFQEALEKSRQSNISSHQPLFLVDQDQVAFPSLEILIITHMDDMKVIWNTQFVEGSFCKLQNMGVEYCANLNSIFPFHMFKVFQSLELLNVVHCSSLKQVFDLQGPSFQETNVITVTQLKHLYLDHLPKLKHISNKDPRDILSFQNLRRVRVIGCESMECLFPASMARTLTELESLVVLGCGVEVIVDMEEAEGRLVFPKLTFLALEALRKLKWISPGAHNLELPVLKELRAWGCDQVSIFASKFSRFQEISQQCLLESSIQHPLFLVEEGTFPKLEVLSSDLHDMTTWHDQLFIESCNLKVLEVQCNHDTSAIFPSNLLKSLQNLEKLVVSCNDWHEIFPFEEFIGPGNHAMLLPQLKELRVSKARMLTHLWKEDIQESLVFHKVLEILAVSECHKLKSLVPSSVCFHNLTDLEILSCNGLIHLITYPTAKSLVQLRKMSVSSCEGITEIMAKGNDQAKVVITFSKLTCLKFDCLPNFTSFCSESYSIMFPYLEEVFVGECPVMKTFSHGVLSTPKLKGVQATTRGEKSHTDWKNNLNSTIHSLWKNKQV
ncbi:hypothetical protein I3843_08G163600 [Carya illinoinensis]|nr:hypothetical protein I3843_08G163600 [Carya illinoinensis]KAG7968611.1 hypothetical protein I3843_08G163600 [Carya illinoinensis]